tara:strand:+ start:580 stop:1698 length:1119 start_codon:yes stop_codon:yes gene_type:complete
MEKTNKKMSNKYSNHEDEIDLIALTKNLWEGRKVVFKTTLIFLGLGLFVALTSPSEYTSTIVVKPALSDPNSKLGGGIGGLAAMAGINLGGGGSVAEIHPTLYPKIVESYSFQKELMQSYIYVEKLNSEVSFEQYYTELHDLSILELLKKYTLGLPKLILSIIMPNEEACISAENIYHTISETDKEMITLLKEQLHVNVDEKEGFVSISARMPVGLQAAQMVSNAQNILQRKVINHKLKKVEEDLSFIEERYIENKKAFEKAQENLAKYRDANRNVNTAIALTEAERLESEYQLAFSVYSELAKQVETQKIQVKENTPVFAVLQDAVVPLEKSSTSKIMTLIIWSFLGLFLGSALTFVKTFAEDIKEKWEAS